MFEFIQMKMLILKELKLTLKSIIKKFNVIINGKNFYDQAFDSDIKRYEEIWKLKTEQGEDYTTGYFLEYDYNH